MQYKDIFTAAGIIAAFVMAYVAGYCHGKTNADLKTAGQTAFVSEQQSGNTAAWHGARDDDVRAIEKGKSKNEECAFVLNYPVVDCLRADQAAGELLSGV